MIGYPSTEMKGTMLVLSYRLLRTERTVGSRGCVMDALSWGKLTVVSSELLPNSGPSEIRTVL
jgi:hypothetical protein